MASKKLKLDIAPNFRSNDEICDKSEIQKKLSALVKLLAKDAAQQFAMEGGLS